MPVGFETARLHCIAYAGHVFQVVSHKTAPLKVSGPNCCCLPLRLWLGQALAIQSHFIDHSLSKAVVFRLLMVVFAITTLYQIPRVVKPNFGIFHRLYLTTGWVKITFLLLFYINLVDISTQMSVNSITKQFQHIYDCQISWVGLSNQERDARKEARWNSFTCPSSLIILLSSSL